MAAADVPEAFDLEVGAEKAITYKYTVTGDGTVRG